MLKTESISVFGFTKSGLFRYLDLDKVVKSAIRRIQSKQKKDN